MAINLLTALADKMKWHQARQTLLAENVANAQTPGFRGRDLKEVDFAERLQLRAVPTAVTQPGHILAATGTGGFNSEQAGAFEVTPGGNAVSLEEEMMKVASNQMDYQAATTLYTRSLKLIRTALGRSA
jgi:flagellar basal-body rod protein FlgB